jgi:predicted ribosome-associated RNA-binding protein Tma20
MVLSDEARARQKEAKRQWYEKNKDYKNPDSAKRAETMRKAALKYYNKNKNEINSKNQKIYKSKVKVKQAERKKEILTVRDEIMDFSISDFSIPKRYNLPFLPFKSVYGAVKVEEGFNPLL